VIILGEHQPTTKEKGKESELHKSSEKATKK
jgi:hypothetical protein